MSHPESGPAIVKVVVSIDTEEDNWESVTRGLSVENIRELPEVQRVFGRLGIRPTLFTTYQVASRPWALSIVRATAAELGGEVGSHLHPWNTPPAEGAIPRRATMLNHYPTGFQIAKLHRLTEAFEDGNGSRPRVFRAGRFGVGPRTITALVRCGYLVDSSVTPFLDWRRFDGGPDFLGAPLRVYRVKEWGDPRVPTDDGPLVEVPITVGYTNFSLTQWPGIAALYRRRSARWIHLPGIGARTGVVKRAILSPETNSVPEMIAVSRRVIAAGVPYLHMFFHSSALRPGLTPFTRSRQDVRRLFGTIERFLEELSRFAQIEFATVGEVGGLRNDRATPRATVASPAAAPSNRLVIVNYHFPPDGSVGGLRWAGLGKYLTRAGWEVHVLTAGKWGTRLVDGMQIHSVPRRRTLNDLYNVLAPRLRRVLGLLPPPQGSEKRPASRFPLSVLTALRREVAGMMAFPDESRGWLLRARRQVRSLVKRLHPDVVISSGPPHSAHLAALWGVGAKAIPTVVDLRDPWSVQSRGWFNDPVYGTALARFLIFRMERMVFRRARLIVANTAALLTTLRNQHPTAHTWWLRNGVDPERILGTPLPPFPGLSVAYAGTLYGGRDARPLLVALQDLRERRPDIFAAGSKLRVAGDMEAERRRRLGEAIVESGLQDYVELLDLVPPREALTLLRRSAVAVVLAQEQELQVPAKLYEIVGMRRVPLVLTERGSATADEAARLGVRTFESEETGEISRFLESVFDGRGPKIADDTLPIDYGALAEEMASQLEELRAPRPLP